MINYKLKYNLVGDQNWPSVPSVFLEGINTEKNVTLETPEDQKEEIIQKWKNIAVLNITSPAKTKFYIGFSNMGAIQYLKHEFETDILIGMRIGNDDVRIMALPLNLDDQINIELVEITSENDEKYKDLTLI